MTEATDIVNRAKDHVVLQLSLKLPASITYHSTHHTAEVVNSAMEIADEQDLNDADKEILGLAAWFHDIGYIDGKEGHEERSAKVATAFLQSHDYPASQIEKIVGCILATRMPQDPQSNLEQILCDADMMHLASDDYFKKSDLLHKELTETNICNVNETEWLEMNKDFLTNHCFFTSYAKGKYTGKVKDNLRKVCERLNSWKKVPR